ncbi:hypothetical protein BH11PSE5_BH11PSE5_30150 [soil metagenome]
MSLTLVGQPTPFDDGARFSWQAPGAITVAIVTESLFRCVFGNLPDPAMRVAFVATNTALLLCAAHDKAKREQRLGGTIMLEEKDIQSAVEALSATYRI